MKKNTTLKPLYLVTDTKLSLPKTVEEIVELAAKAGVGLVQLREKKLDNQGFIEKAKAIKKILSPYQIPLIINDTIEVALAVDAEGLHIGQNDIPYQEARKLLGKDKIIGLSVETMKQLEEANTWEVDYLALSPVFSTNTKKDIAKPWGLEGVKKAVNITQKPLVAIGGINLENIASLFDLGIQSAAVVSAICSAKNPQKATEDLLQAISN